MSINGIFIHGSTIMGSLPKSLLASAVLLILMTVEHVVSPVCTLMHLIQDAVPHILASLHRNGVSECQHLTLVGVSGVCISPLS